MEMEIRNRDDAEFILRHRVGVELGKKWKQQGRALYLLIVPLIIYTICMIATYPRSGELGAKDTPDAVGWGLVVIAVWLVIPLSVALSCYGKDKELLIKKYMDEATKAGVIDKEEK
jgi:hypothetical protein